MVPGYYTLEEAAQFLAMGDDELRQLAQKNQIRSFQDRGTLRFRVQDIQELARQRGMASDPDQPLGAPPRSPHKPKKSQLGFPEPVVETGGQDIFDFSLEVNEDSVDIGREMLPPGSKSSSGSKKPGSKPKLGSDSDVRLITDQESISNVGSDSDIRLVGQDSNVNVGSSSARRKSSLPPTGPPLSPNKSALGPGSSGPKSPAKVRSKLVGNSPVPKKSSSNAPLDQGAHFLLKDSDSDVKIVGAGSDEMSMGKTHLGPTDSDIRLEGHAPAPPGSEDAMLLTEEINLDEEIRKQEEAMRQQQKPQAKVRPKSKLPSQFTPPPESAASPFELSSDDATLPPKSSQTPSKMTANPDVDSSDFDLVPAADGSPVEFQGDASDDFSLELPEENVGLGAGDSAPLSGHTSGINLTDPIDGGISLELSQPTPKPAQLQGAGESSSEFEINLDDSSEEHAKMPSPESDFEVGAAALSSSENPVLEPSDSEFELTLDSSSDEVPAMPEGPPASEASTDDSSSDSEFELTLDDSGNLSAEGEGAGAAVGEEGDKDIFETDFEVPGLDEESSSQVGALDTDLESSDFDIQIEDESGSAVVNLDDEEPVEEEEAPAPRKTKLGGKSKQPASKQPASKAGSKQQVKVKKKAADDEEEEQDQQDEETVAEESDDFGFGDLESEEGDFASPDEDLAADEATAAAITPRGAVALRPAPWGVLPTIFMFPCLLVMISLLLLGHELLQTTISARPPGPLMNFVKNTIVPK